MWRDILIILAVILAAFQYFDLTPKRISGYAGTAKTEVTKRKLYQQVWLLFMVVATLVIIYVIIYGFEVSLIDDFLVLLAFTLLAWGTFLTYVWKLTQKTTRVVILVLSPMILALLIAASALSEMPLWQKIVFPLGGICFGYVIRLLSDYLVKRREASRYHE